MDGIVAQQLAFAWIVHVQPRQLVLFNGSFPLFGCVVAVDAQYFELAFVLLVILFHLWETLDAIAAPRAPEVENHVLAFKARHFERLAVEVVQREVGRNNACGLYPSGFVLFFFLFLHPVDAGHVEIFHSAFPNSRRHHAGSLFHFFQFSQTGNDDGVCLVVGMRFDEVFVRHAGLSLQGRCLFLILFHQVFLLFALLHAFVKRLNERLQLRVGVVKSVFHFGELLVEFRSFISIFAVCIAV